MYNFVNSGGWFLEIVNYNNILILNISRIGEEIYNVFFSGDWFLDISNKRRGTFNFTLELKLKQYINSIVEFSKSIKWNNELF